MQNADLLNVGDVLGVKSVREKVVVIFGRGNVTVVGNGVMRKTKETGNWNVDFEWLVMGGTRRKSEIGPK